MTRSNRIEILDQPGVREDQARQAHRQLTHIHRWLGDTAAVITALRRDPQPLRRVMDIGCGHGGVLESVRRKLPVEVIGVDLKPQVIPGAGIAMCSADAVRDPLPQADAAFCLYLGHHLTEDELIGLIRNVGRSCRRFILLDLVRHRLPLSLFRAFVAPFVCPIVFHDGRTSIARSYTCKELKGITARALAGSGATFTHRVAPLYIRQIIDIAYGPAPVNQGRMPRREGSLMLAGD